MTYLKVVLEVYKFLATLLSPIAPVMAIVIASAFFVAPKAYDMYTDLKDDNKAQEVWIEALTEEVERLKIIKEEEEDVAENVIDGNVEAAERACRDIQVIDRYLPSSKPSESRTEAPRAVPEDISAVLTTELPDDILKALDPRYIP